MSALILSACCCEIDGECCNSTWGAAQSQDLSLNFSTPWTDSYREVRWESCTAFGVTNYPRKYLYTRRSRVTFTNVVMRKRTGTSGTSLRWAFYSGTVSLEHVSYAALFGTAPSPPPYCVPNTSGSFTCENTMSITASVVASAGNYTTSSSGTCSSNGSAALSWSSEPTDWDDDWFYIAQDCVNVDFSACGDNGTVLDFTNRQFRLFGPTWPGWSSASGNCPGCYPNHPSPLTSSEYFALNPDCSENDMEDITWYGYSQSSLPYCGSNSCTVTGCASCGYFRSDVYDTSLPSSLGSSSLTCISRGLERPTMTLS
jgi:hypothetical protein